MINDGSRIVSSRRGQCFHVVDQPLTRTPGDVLAHTPSCVPSTETYADRAFLKFTDAINVTTGSSGTVVTRLLKCRL